MNTPAESPARAPRHPLAEEVHPHPGAAGIPSSGSAAMGEVGPVLRLLHDGDCPLCAREVAFLRRRDRAGRLAFTDIAAPEFDPRPLGASREQLMARIHAVLPDGTLIDGVEVFRRCYAAVGLGWLVAPTRWPLLAPLTELAYRVFARTRLPLGRLLGRRCVQGSCEIGRR